MKINPKRIEELSLNAWPALQQVLYDGWLLRFSKGYTKRANSINPLFSSTLDLEQKVAYCEGFYTERALKTIFRLTPFSSPPELDQFLDRRGYQVLDPTLVMILDLQNMDLHSRHETEIQPSLEIDEWLSAYSQVSQAPSSNQDIHKEILKTITARTHMVTIKHAGVYAACGLGVLEHEYVGLFDIVTAPRFRRHGCATQIVIGILVWARQHGTRHAYLQVMEQNSPGRQLYEKLGFEEFYRYWYRMPQ
jgi:GNAT superfamily N-acetyltransferase